MNVLGDECPGDECRTIEFPNVLLPTPRQPPPSKPSTSPPVILKKPVRMLNGCMCEEEVMDRCFVFSSLHYAAIHAIRDIKSFEK